jgi:hypothetical protein
MYVETHVVNNNRQLKITLIINEVEKNNIGSSNRYQDIMGGLTELKACWRMIGQ